MYMYNYIEMARVTGVPMSFLLTRGQSIKVFSQILRKARQKNLVVPFLKVCCLAAAMFNTLELMVDTRPDMVLWHLYHEFSISQGILFTQTVPV